MTIYTFVLHFHSVLRWILLLSLLYTISAALIRWRFPWAFTRFSPLAAMLAVSLAHLQVLSGIILYILSPKVVFVGEMVTNTLLRFFTIEHSSMMLVAVIILTIGSVRARKAPTDRVRAKRIFFWFLTSLIIILASIPWPFRIPGSGWI